jgi:hypothetical protein
MHETLDKNIKGHIDVSDRNGIRGWCFHVQKGACDVRLSFVIDGAETHLVPTIIQRDDVGQFYNNDFTFCGWDFDSTNTYLTDIRIECQYDDEWTVAFVIIRDKIYTANTRNMPSFLVIDDFYDNVDAVRELALSQTFTLRPESNKGQRTDAVFRFSGVKERFEELLRCKIKNWTNYPVNGCFQFCIGGDQLVYHRDVQEYAGVLFLTPNAPIQAGTTFYRSIHTRNVKVNNDHAVVFKNGFLDPTEFEAVDVVGNVYNRLVLFDAHMFHAASTYFGNSLENGRLFQIFFFDVR